MSELCRALRRVQGAAAAAATALTVCLAGRGAAQAAPFTLQSISVGSNHACGVTAQHAAYCWGRNAEGELGNSTSNAACAESGEPCSLKPVKVEGTLAFASISAGNNYTCAVTTTGAAYCWGLGVYGQLGNGSQASSSRPVRVTVEATVQSISAGANHTCAVATSGVAYCWGSNAGGKLGAGGSLTGGHTAPVLVAGHLAFRTISAGYYHTCGVTRDGRTYCWGRNDQGEVGSAAKGASSVPVRVAGELVGRQVHAAGQFDYSCAVDQNGSLFCWGANCYGQLGLDSTTEQCGMPEMPCSSKPAAVHATGSFQSVSADFSHTCALTASGGVVCWGENNQGQLANGTTGGRTTTPTPIAGSLTYRAVSTGREFTCALTTEGAPQCWGRNADGQLGAGAEGNRNTPTAVVSP
jgi:alpha-tubulin suppressor-like RCC1 family protein